MNDLDEAERRGRLARLVPNDRHVHAPGERLRVHPEPGLELVRHATGPIGSEAGR